MKNEKAGLKRNICVIGRALLDYCCVSCCTKLYIGSAYLILLWVTKQLCEFPHWRNNTNYKCFICLIIPVTGVFVLIIASTIQMHCAWGGAHVYSISRLIKRNMKSNDRNHIQYINVMWVVLSKSNLDNIMRGKDATDSWYHWVICRQFVLREEIPP